MFLFVIFQCIFRNIEMTMSDTRDFTISHQNFKKQQDHQTLTNIIVSWNSTRLDLFELSLPNENLEFSGKTVNYIVFKTFIFCIRSYEVLLPAPGGRHRPEGVHQVCEGGEHRQHCQGRRDSHREVQVRSYKFYIHPYLLFQARYEDVRSSRICSF